ncbi:hypothetical protein RND81_02G059300 [Saponaria officinalis]|uniref:S-acyltransferase n=1 Tax=Saponaria officinalis TaxID=3572 RepID=A0AAW1MS94_SAPOF
MVRRHGWQLPAHYLQISAISVYLLLSIAFYVFIAPFVAEAAVYVYVATGVYTFLAVGVLILYARCTAIDPADPGILVEPDITARSHYEASLPGDASSIQERCKSVVCEREDAYCPCSCSRIGGIFCFCLVQEDCRKDEEIKQQPSEEEALFCTLCNAEVRKFSKHCRSCDKCVDGFDHHCRWLNNCVGKKNYASFLCLMAMSVLWLVAECGIGVWVLVRCFVFKKFVEPQISERLGDGFTRAPYVSVVAFCTFLSFLALVPLGELFFFHMILIRKGITTYEYVVAMRTQSEPGGPSIGGGEQQSLPSSPTSSAVTAISGRSSVGIGLQYKGAWCTPPRIFQDEIEHLEPTRVVSTVDPDNIQQVDKGKKVPAHPVRISAWRLAKLDSNEAAKAAAKARASSSVLRPITSRPHAYDSDQLSSSNVSLRSSPISKINSRTRIPRLSSAKSSYPPSRASQEDIDMEHFNPMYQLSANQSPLSSRAGEPSDNAGPTSTAHTPLRKNELNAGEREKNTVYWDQEAGRFVSATSRAVASRTELSYTGQSIFFGGPLVNENVKRGVTSSGSSGGPEQGGYFQQGRRQRGDQIPVFVPSDAQQGQLP